MLLQIILVVFVIILGFFVRFKKPSILIPSPNLVAGVNTIKQEDMEKYDLDALCKFVSNMLFTVALLLILRVILSILGFSTISMLIIPILFLFILICSIYANTGNRFKKDSM
ncbi:MAG: DUF3784 domain-containing protein [Dethiobacter sp.]|nr:DUF3784 domain-containing protein [Dethiobacter sp.]